MTKAPVQRRFEVAPGADRTADPRNWVWQDESDLLPRDALEVKVGRDDEESETPAARVDVALKNGKTGKVGRWTPGNAMSPLHPYVDAGMPARVVAIGGTPHVTLPGTGSVPSTADDSSLDITTDLSGVAEVVPFWSPPSLLEQHVIASKWDAAGDQRSWLFGFTNEGVPLLARSTDGAIGLVIEATAPIPRIDTFSAWGWWVDVSNAGNKVFTFYWAPTRAELLANPAAHVLGDPVVLSGTMLFFSSSAPLRIGDATVTVSDVFTPMAGMVRSFQLRSGDLSTGTVVADISFSGLAEGATATTDVAGRAWTFPALDRRHIRLSGETGAVRPTWPQNGVTAAARSQVAVSGPLRRLGKGEKPLHSALRRKITSPFDADVVRAYWPWEDERSATSVASPIAGVAPMVVSGAIQFGSAADIDASRPLASLASGAAGFWTGNVPAYGSTDAGLFWSFEWLVDIPVPETSPASTNLQAIGTNGTVRNWVFTVNGTSITITALDAVGANVFSPATFAWDARMAVPSMLRLEVQQSGGNVAWEAHWKPVTGSGAGVVFGTTGLFAGSAGVMTRVANVAVGPPEGMSWGHMVVASDRAISWLSPADTAYVGDRAAARFRRLCQEEGVSVTIVGDPADSEPMGPQRPLELTALLQECRDADLGIMAEQRYRDGLLYRTRTSLYNQPQRLTIPKLRNPFEPAADDNHLHNDIEVQRVGGSSHREVDEDGVRGVKLKGRYDDSPAVNISSDDLLPNQAGWRLRLGTWPEPRYPSLTARMSGRGDVYLDSWLAFCLGDRLVAPNPPTGHPPAAIDQIAQGWEETLGSFTWDAEIGCSPAGPLNVGVVEDDVLGKADTDGSQLYAAVDSDDTTFDVAVTDGNIWTVDDTEFPFEAILRGEVVNTTDIAASLVTFGAAGTAAHASNASVTPGLPASTVAGNLLLCLAAIRNSGVGVPDTPTGYTRLPVFDVGDNVQLFAKVAGASEAAPTITFTGGVALATTSAQMARLAGNWADAANILSGGSARSQLNGSAQDIAYPELLVGEPNCIVLYLGWKQDDWTSVATIASATEIGEPSSTTGDDQGLVWDYVIQTTAARIPAGSFVVTGGAAAISRGGVIALRCDRQTWTVVRSVNEVEKSHPAGTAISLAHPMVAAL